MEAFRLVKVCGVVIRGSVEEVKPRRSDFEIEIDADSGRCGVARVPPEPQMVRFRYEHGTAGAVVERVADDADLVFGNRRGVEGLIESGLSERPEVFDRLVREQVQWACTSEYMQRFAKRGTAAHSQTFTVE